MRTVENGAIGSWIRIDAGSNNTNFIWNQNASAQTTGNFWVSGTGRTNGTFTGGGSTVISADNIQVNDLGAGARYAYIDLEGDDTYTDYGLRLMRGNGGVNATSTLTHRGTGDLQIHTNEAAALTFHTTNAERMRIQAGGNVGVNSNAPSNRLYVNDVAATMATVNTYQFGLGLSGATNLTLGADASYGLIQTWASKPLLINSQGNNVGINRTTAPIQTLDVNGRINVQNGVIQRGTTAITASSDLGLYHQIAGNWIRIASNAAPIKFFVDQGGGNGAGTNAVMAVDNANGGGVMIAAENGGTGNANSPNSKAALEISSTTKGMLTPRLTTAQRDAMGTGLAEGLLIYNTTNDCFEFWDTKANPGGAGGFWNSLCQWCQNVVIVSANQTGFNLNSYVGGARAEQYCVYINSGVTLQASGAGGAGFNATTMPTGATITLYNYGNILAGGGNGGQGARESDAVCAGDIGCGGGAAGGDAIVTSSSVPVRTFNYGLIRAGGGGGGGGGLGCCSAGGGGGGGAGTPAGSGGSGQCWNCVSGFVCGCGRSGCSGGGGTGTATTGAGGGGSGNTGASTSCPGTCTSGGGGTGGTGGANGAGGGTGTNGGCSGGAAGLAQRGNGSGSSLSNISGTVTGSTSP
jgi:hypothetical protein